MALTDLPPLLRDEPAMLQVLGRNAAVLAVPEPARPLALAGLATVGSRRPILVAVPTTAEAERLVNDLVTYLGPDAAELFPAWETLPFERVSPGIETMGRRVRTIWRLRGGAGELPAIVVAPVRALVQHLGPHVDDAAARGPSGRAATRPSWWPGSAPTATGEGQVEHRGEFAVRGSIVDVFGSTAEVPVRIDLWGDEVDRLTTFSVADQRSTGDLEVVQVFPCRELLPTPDVRARRAADRRRAVGARAVGAPRRGPALRRDGELAALAGRRAAHDRRPVARRVAGRGDGAAAPARSRRRPAGRGARPRHHPRPDVGGGEGGASRSSTAASRTSSPDRACRSGP
ncbi:MAG: hypothetical protein R2711_16120 [Acidimicrobiales bacterium]